MILLFPYMIHTILLKIIAQCIVSKKRTNYEYMIKQNLSVILRIEYNLKLNGKSSFTLITFWSKEELRWTVIIKNVMREYSIIIML